MTILYKENNHKEVNFLEEIETMKAASSPNCLFLYTSMSLCPQSTVKEVIFCLKTQKKY